MQPAWWHQTDVLSRWTRDALTTEMAALRPGGWAWPATVNGDVHLRDDAHADSLELMALNSAWAEQLDLRDEALLQQMMDQPTWRNWAEIARVRFAQDDTQMRFATSGSTGRPQRVVHATAELWQEAQCIAQHLRARGPAVQRIVSTVRSHHIYGFLFTVLLPMALGTPPVVDAVGQPPALVRQRLQPGDLVVAFPDWWAMATQAGSSTAWPADITGVSSTAPCPSTVAHAALAQGLTRWIEVYGSTETAGVGWREHPDEPFMLQPYWRAVALNGEAHDDHPERMLQRIPPEAESLDTPPIPTTDHLHWLDDRHFRPVARRDGVVQVGGTNVSPAWVAQQLLTHPAVAEAAVRPCTVKGTPRLKAFVVPEPASTEADQHGMATTLMAWCRQHLPPAARPVDIRVGAQLPRNEVGKLCDWELDASKQPER